MEAEGSMGRATPMMGRATSIMGVLIFLSAFPAALLAKDLGIDGLTANWAPPDLTLSWDAMESSSTATSTTSANVEYQVYYYPGYTTSTTTVITLGTLLWTMNEGTSLKLGDFAGSDVYSFVVLGVDLLTSNVDASPIAYSHFIHNNLSPLSQDIVRKDAANTQDGAGQQWYFDYKLRGDAYMTIAVYPPGTTFTKTAAGFIDPTSASAAPVKVVLDNVPRSYQMNGDEFINHDFWDLRDSSGTVVTKGIYYALFTARGWDATTIVDTALKTIPNDALRITRICPGAGAITDASPVTNIQFNVNADCQIKAIICSPGTKFSVAAAAGSLSYLTSLTYSYGIGDILPLNPDTLAVDGTRLLKVYVYNVVSGNVALPWDGTDDAGTVLDSGLYVYSLSAEDAFGNHAVQSSSDNYPYWGTIPINRNASQPLPAISLVATYPRAGDVVKTPLNSLYASFDLTDDAVLDGDKSTLVLLDPSAKPVAGIKKWNDTFKRLEYYLPHSLDQKGEYSLTISVHGTRSAGALFDEYYTSTFFFQPPQSLEEAYVCPNPIKGVDTAQFVVNLNGNSTVRLRIYNVLGELVCDRSEARPGGVQNLPWNLKNDWGQKLASGIYVYRLDVADGSGERNITKKLVLIQ